MKRGVILLFIVGTIAIAQVVVHDGADLTVGWFADAEVVSGNPAVAYADLGSYNIYYVRANDSTGATWGTPTSIASNATFPTMAVIAGNPAIAYVNRSDFSVDYKRANDATGSSWPAAHQNAIDSTNPIGWLSMVEHQNTAAIAYVVNYTPTKSQIYYLKATDAIGSSWTSTQVLNFTTFESWHHPSLEIVNGRPAIATVDVTGNIYSLAYIRANNTDGSSWPSSATIVDTSGTVPFLSPSLEVVDGNPAIAALKGDDLIYCRATDVDGTSWGSCTTVLVGVRPVHLEMKEFTSANRIVIAFLDGKTYDLKLIISSDSIGSSWNAPILLDSSGLVGIHPSVVDVGSATAGIAYFDMSFGRLKFTTQGNVPVTLKSLFVE